MALVLENAKKPMYPIFLCTTHAIMYFVTLHLSIRYDGMYTWNVKATFSLISVVYNETSGGQAYTSFKKTSKKHWQQGQCASVCHHFPQPKAKRTTFDLEAGMAFWALDYQNPACFHVVSILPEKGHCYRLNNLNQYKTETECIHVPN